MIKTPLYNDEIYTVDGVLSQSQCTQIIKKAQSKGWNNSSPSGGGHGRTGKEDPRTNKFCVFYDDGLSQELWKIIQTTPPDLSFRRESLLHSLTKALNGILPLYMINQSL